jgi:predicted transposase YbfD/YdcC
VREIWTSTQMNEWFEKEWAGIAQVFMLRKTVKEKGKEIIKVSYGITHVPRAKADAKSILGIKRKHWWIENHLHYRRDVTLREDASHVRTRGAPEVLAALNGELLAMMDYMEVKNVAKQMRHFVQNRKKLSNGCSAISPCKTGKLQSPVLALFSLFSSPEKWYANEKARRRHILYFERISQEGETSQKEKKISLPDILQQQAKEHVNAAYDQVLACGDVRKLRRLDKARKLWLEKIDEEIGKSKGLEISEAKLLEKSYEATRKDYKQRWMSTIVREDKYSLLHQILEKSANAENTESPAAFRCGALSRLREIRNQGMEAESPSQAAVPEISGPGDGVIRQNSNDLATLYRENIWNPPSIVFNYRQNSNDLATLYRDAVPAHNQLQEFVKYFVGKYGGEPLFPELKGMERAKEKIELSYRGDTSKLCDIARVGINVNTIKELKQVKQQIEGEIEKFAPGARVLGVYDRYEKPHHHGYCDILFDIQMSNGHIGELQLNTTTIFAVKKEAMGIYKVLRVAERKSQAENRPFTSEEKEEVDRLTQQIRAIYERAFKKIPDYESV